MKRLTLVALILSVSLALASCGTSSDAKAGGSKSPTEVASPASAITLDGIHGGQGPDLPRDEYLDKEFVRVGSPDQALSAVGASGSCVIPPKALGADLKAVYMAPEGMEPPGFVARYANGIEIKVMKMASAEVVTELMDGKKGDGFPRKKLFKANGKAGLAYSKGQIDEVIEPGGRVKPGTGVTTSHSGAELQAGRYRILVTSAESIDPKELLQIVRDMDFEVVEE